MTEIQILTLAIPITMAIILPLSLLIYSNTRITDAKEILRAEMNSGFDKMRAEMDHRFDRLEAKIDAHIEHMEMRIKLHEMEHHHPPKS